jgi:hypothetical protein
MAIENTFLMDNGSCPRLHEQTVNSRLQEKGETERNGDWERERDTLFRDVMFPRDGARLVAARPHFGRVFLRPMDYLLCLEEQNHSRSGSRLHTYSFASKIRKKDDKEHPLRELIRVR